MSEKPAPLFLERRSYRQRRLMDAARLAPLLAAILWAVPLLWPRQGAEAMPTSTSIIYIFGVWLAMVGVSLVLSRRLTEADDDTTTPRDGGGGA